MRVIDENLLAEFRQSRRCECCGMLLREPAQPHHVRSRGMGGGSRLDVRINLIALGGPADCNCHGSHHAKGVPSRKRLKKIVAERERRTVQDIEAELNRILAAPKQAP